MELATTLVNTVIWITSILAVGLLVTITFVFKGYKHRIIIKELRNGSKSVIEDKFKIKRDRDGAVWWRTLKTKLRIVPPPDKVREITKKGRIFVQGYLLDGETFVPAYDSLDATDDKRIKEIVDAMQPYTTEERAIMVNQHVKSERDKRKSIGEMIAAAAPYMAIILILAVFMIFWKEAVQPIQEIGDSILAADKERIEMNKVFVQTMDKALDVLENRQYATGGDTSNLSGVPPG